MRRSVVRRRTRFSRVVSTTALGLILAVSALVVPDSAVHPTQLSLVKVHRASAVDLSPGVTWILAVGSDARPGEDMTRTRGDALQLVGIDNSTGAAAAIGVPRDSYVEIAGHGTDKINAALYYGGPQLLGRTVGDLVGIEPDYVFVTRFKAFIDLVDGIGGITVHNPVAFDDEYLKPEGFAKGRIRLDGYGAMAFSRVRHNLLRGDFDRSANQQRTLRGIQAAVRAQAGDPGFVQRGVLSVMKNLATDLSPGELFTIAQAMVQVDPAKITSCVVQGDIGDVGGASVVLPSVDQARRLGDEARADATLERC